jgi:hypothetical protein
MKVLVFLVSILLSGLVNSQIKAEAKTQQILGKNIGYYITLKNVSSKKVDGVKWQAYFYDNFEELKGVRDGKWESGNFISPIEPGEETEDLENVWVSGATKVKIKIIKVHFEK